MPDSSDTAEPRDQSLTDALVRQPTFVAAPAVLNAPPLVLAQPGLTPIDGTLVSMRPPLDGTLVSVRPPLDGTLVSVRPPLDGTIVGLRPPIDDGGIGGPARSAGARSVRPSSSTTEGRSSSRGHAPRARRGGRRRPRPPSTARRARAARRRSARRPACNRARCSSRWTLPTPGASTCRSSSSPSTTSTARAGSASGWAATPRGRVAARRRLLQQGPRRRQRADGHHRHPGPDVHHGERVAARVPARRGQESPGVYTASLLLPGLNERDELYHAMTKSEWRAKFVLRCQFNAALPGEVSETGEQLYREGPSRSTSRSTASSTSPRTSTATSTEASRTSRTARRS